jgi:tRNA A-37 threonylcarbamoyl transferase component Bud32
MPSARFFVDTQYRDALAEIGLASVDAVFAFATARDLAKPTLRRFRRRLQFEVVPSGAAAAAKVFLKRYDRPPLLQQLSNWLLHHRRCSFALAERQAAERIARHGICTPQTVACGEEWGLLWERRSFLMTEEVPNAEALERQLPACFAGTPTPERLRTRREFIRRLAVFVRRFHDTGYRHRDLYFSHIFHSPTGEFYLIDLARASRPIRQRRFQIKDLAQVHYSAPAASFSRTDRLRFYLAYAGRRRLTRRDRVFLCSVARKAAKMARHSAKHGVAIPFLER